ncbi:uncharacterized protein LOC126781910 [Nymphalis io]|uniref:uncharacterized protein LOC126781910 n=1 Tax=Inachis io TaxID=171585 RepID=UPI002167E487|nr:uncharacterized protein LOC126781910 [Nymphalis io]
MEYHNINNTLFDAERVTSTYAEIFLDENSASRICDDEASIEEVSTKKSFVQKLDQKDEWISPSDLLVTVVKLVPPFTSKITRGKTHEGILDIGNTVLEKERAKFLKSLEALVHDNDASWANILAHEKQEVIKKVKNIFRNIYKHKSDIMKYEISMFYESSLQDLEKHLNSEVQSKIQTAYANIISDLNIQIQNNLLKERKKLENILKKKFTIEVTKLKKYYSLLLRNELHRNKILIVQAIQERNDAIKAFYKQIEAERITSTMYVMSLERKKCNIRRILLENLQTDEIRTKRKKIEEKAEVIESFKRKYVGMLDINKHWEQKIKKILQLFLKFISFSLKILPEQTTFLLDLEKLMMLQLIEIKKNPVMCTTILKSDDIDSNVFQFEQSEQEIPVCDKNPFIVVGDSSDPIPKAYGSRETLPSDVDLPYFRVGRQYFYAKCHGYEGIKKYLESQKCKCRIPRELSPPKKVSHVKIPSKTTSESIKKESSLESLLLEDIARLEDCPVRKCTNWIKTNSFPNLANYLEYTQENYERVTTILESRIYPDSEMEMTPYFINPKDIAYSELPFSATKERHHSVGTQYLSSEDLSLPKKSCPCVDDILEKDMHINSKINCTLKTSYYEINAILAKRNKSLERLMDKNPNLLKMFTDESFDYKL